MAAVLGWVSLLLIAYLFAALFYVEQGSKRVLSLIGPLSSQAPRGNWRRLVWVKQHRSQLPTDIRALANRIVAFDLSARITVVVLFVLYGAHLVAL